jgi:hypothetical protein
MKSDFVNAVIRQLAELCLAGIFISEDTSSEIELEGFNEKG